MGRRLFAREVVDVNDDSALVPTASLAIPLLVAADRITGCAQLYGGSDDAAVLGYTVPVLDACGRYLRCWSPCSLSGVSDQSLSACLAGAAELSAAAELVGWPAEVKVRSRRLLRIEARVLRLCLEARPMGRLRREAALAFMGLLAAIEPAAD